MSDLEKQLAQELKKQTINANQLIFDKIDQYKTKIIYENLDETQYKMCQFTVMVLEDILSILEGKKS